MTPRRIRLVVCLFALISASISPAAAEAWTATTWHGEAAYQARSASGEWLAIVSVERGRLVHLGASEADTDNLLLFTPSKDHPLGWGGHRAWLGPQREWPRGWPPPDAWEASAADARVDQGKSRLVLEPPPTGYDWPDLRRTYQWTGDSLDCAVEVRGDIERDVQIVQIIQIPTDATVTVLFEPTEEAPAGYIQLPSYFRSDYRFEFESPPHLLAPTDDSDRRVFRFVPDEPEKFAFTTRPLVASRNGVSLTMSVGAVAGEVVGAPDHGYDTQLFFGGRQAFVEIEQLTPLLSGRADSPRGSRVLLTPRRGL